MSYRKASLYTHAGMLNRMVEDSTIGLLHSHAGKLFLALQEVGFVKPEHLPTICASASPNVMKYLDGWHTEYGSTAEANRVSRRIEGHIGVWNHERLPGVTLVVRWYARGSRDPLMTSKFVVYFDTCVMIRTDGQIGLP